MSSLSFWQRVRRTPYQGIASIFMVFLTLLIMGIFLTLAAGSSALLTHFESLPQFNVYFTDQKEKASVDQLIEKIKATGKVSKIVFISKEEALNRYKQDNQSDPLLLEMVTADILPASLEISATSAQYLPELADMVKKEEGVDEVVFQKDAVDTLVSWTGAVRKIGIVATAFLIAETLLILLTIIGMKIAMRKEEIDILKLVGATAWYIKKPFIYEGIFYGITGAALASAALTGMIMYLNPFVTSFLKGVPSLTVTSIAGVHVLLWPPSVPLFAVLWGVLLACGFCIGLLGSYIAASRFLKF